MKEPNDVVIWYEGSARSPNYPEKDNKLQYPLGGLMQLVANGYCGTVLHTPASSFDFCKKICSHNNAQIKSGDTENGLKSFKFPNHGDLVHTVYLKIKHEKLESNMEYLMIDEIKLFVNKQLIDKHTGQWLYIQTELTKKYKSLYDTESNMYYIPLQFAFNKNIELSLPSLLVDIEIQVKMNEKFNCNDMSMYANYIYLDTEERKELDKNGVSFNFETLKYSITELNQIDTDNSLLGTFGKIDLQECETQEMIWVLCGKDTNEFSIIKKAKITLNNNNLNDYESDFHYNKLIPQQYYNNIPSPGIYVHKFTPSNECPRSCIKLDRIDKSNLRFQLKEQHSSVTVYCYTKTYTRLHCRKKGGETYPPSLQIY
jgi:hypothetical protein